MRSTTLLLAGLIFVASASAQAERENRLVTLTDFFADGLTWSGVDQEITVRPMNNTFGALTFVPAMLLAGGAQFLDGTGSGSSLPSFVLCGRNPAANNGVLQLAEWSQQSLAYVTPPGRLYEETGSDFVGVAWASTSQVLFLLDAKKQQIVMSPYVAGDPLPVTWGLVANSITEPSLADADGLHMTVREEGTDVFLILSNERAPTAKDRKVIEVTLQGPVVSTIPGFDGRVSWILEEDRTDGQTSVEVKGPPNTAVEVLDVEDPSFQVIGSGTTDGTGTAFVALSTPLTMGRVYGTKASTVQGDPLPPFVTPVFRDGLAEALDAGSTIRPFPSGLALTAYVDAPRFKVPLWLDSVDESQVQVPASYDLILHSNFTPDIVTLPDGRKTLVPSSVNSATLKVWDKEEPGFGFLPMPIPDDPNLGGVKVYFQWAVVLDPILPIVKLSDIFGLEVRDSLWVPIGSEDLFGAGGASARSSSEPTIGVVRPQDQRAAARAWLEDCGFEAVSQKYVRQFLQNLRRTRE